MAEGKILKELEFNVLEANDIQFFKFFATACTFGKKEISAGLYFLQLTLLEGKFLAVRPSLRAAAISNILLRVFRRGAGAECLPRQLHKQASIEMPALN